MIGFLKDVIMKKCNGLLLGVQRNLTLTPSGKKWSHKLCNKYYRLLSKDNTFQVLCQNSRQAGFGLGISTNFYFYFADFTIT